MMRALRGCGVALMVLLLMVAGVVTPARADDPKPPTDSAAPVDTTEGAAAREATQVIDQAHPVETSSTDVELVAVAPEPEAEDSAEPTAPASETTKAESVLPQAESESSQAESETAQTESAAPQAESASPQAESAAPESAAPETDTESPEPTSAAPTAEELDLPVETDGRSVRVANAETSADVSVAGVTWQEADAEVQVFMRSTSDGETTAWEELEAIPTSPENSVGGTEPLVVTGRSTVELATVSSQSVTPTLSLVDPGTSSADAMATTSATSSAPVVYTRADWGADESMRDGRPTYAKVNGVVIHHTAGSNSYTEDQVPAIIRGIYRYHTQDLNWSDIGYNVLVDKFGRAWEGRWGGLTRAVQGAHAYGTNHLTFGISVLGNYETARPSAATLDTVARVSGWKMAIHSVDTHATLYSSTGRYFPAISGHRDSYATDCPGQYIYSQMGSLRSKIRQYQGTYGGVTAESAGYKIVGETTYTWGTAQGAPNADVWTEVMVGSKWSRSQTRTTNGSGYFTIPLTYGANSPGTYTWRVGVRTSTGVKYSNRFTITRVVKPTVAAASAGRKPVGQDTNTWGTTTGAPNAEVWTEVRVGNRWSRSQTGRTDASGKFVLPLTYGSHALGTWHWRVAVRTNVGVFRSAEFTLTRTTAPVTVGAASAGTKPVGQTTYTWGTAAGAPNVRVWTEVNLPSGWSRSQVGTTDARGGFTLPLTYGANQSGSHTWRVGVSTSKGVFYSPSFALRRV